jgi:hypothetical protein
MCALSTSRDDADADDERFHSERDANFDGRAESWAQDDLENRICARAEMLEDRYGYSPEYAFLKAQDDLCPVDEP